MSRVPARIRLIVLAFVSVFALVALPASAATRAASSAGRTGFGLGVEFGFGAGLNAKYAPSVDHAFQFGLHTGGYGYRYRHGDLFYSSGVYFLHGEYLKTGNNLSTSADFALPWYAGGGLDIGTGVGSVLGIHGNVGLALQLRGAPLDFFLEWTPRLWLTDGSYLALGDFNGGIRFWF